MALIGGAIAVCSVGIACQTAYQIERQQAVIEAALGAVAGHLEKHTTPFDWLYVPVDGAARMIAAEEYYPRDMDELDGSRFAREREFVDAGGWYKPFWAKYGVHFWHEKFDEPEAFCSKRQHAVDNFRLRMSIAQRRVFVVSNTQNNILRTLKDAGRAPIDTSISWESAVKLYASLVEQYWPCEVAVVATQKIRNPGTLEMVTAGGKRRAAITVHRFEDDRSQWQGDDRQWADLFRRIIP